MKVRAAGFEPAICASASAPLVYRTLGQGSSEDVSESSALIAGSLMRSVVAGMSTISTTLAMFILAGCATTGAVPEKVLVPVPVPCVKDAPLKPFTMEESVILSMDDYSATITAWTERLLLKAYADKAEALLIACR